MHRNTRRRYSIVATIAVLVALAASTTAATATDIHHGRSPAKSGVDNWITYHYTQNRHGWDPNLPIAGDHPTTAWTARLDGAVYAEPLVVFGKIIAVTENDTVYALSLRGKVLWKHHLGAPVPRSELPCGDIDPLGITGTPIYRVADHAVYLTAEVDNPIHHELFAINPTTGHIDWSRDIDPHSMVASATQERGALAIAKGRVWVPFGGLYGDCGAYHGWVIGTPLSGRGPLSVYRQPSSREAGIWAPSGPAVDAHGHLYVAIGNGAATAPPYDDSDSILELNGNQKMSLFAPSDWAQENADDLDLGSTGPILFGALGKLWAYGDGKAGTGYLLHQGALGGIGGEAASVQGCASWSGMAFRGGLLYVPCSSGLTAYRVVAGPAVHRRWSNASIGYGAAPVIGGEKLWAVSGGSLYEVNPQTGATIATVGLGTTPHFVTPTLHGSLVLVGTVSGVTAVTS
jgi:hypothetical protein